MHAHSFEILKAHLERKQKSHRSYSLRAFARDIGVTPGFASQVFSGKKLIPISRIPQIRKVLELDDRAEENLKNLIVLETHKRNGAEIKNLATVRLEKTKPDLKLVDRSRYEVLSRWYYLPILDLLTCTPAPTSATEIARRLGLTLETARSALEFLTSLGLITHRNGNLEKTATHLEFPANTPNALIQNFHREMISKALDALSDPNYDARLITGATLAVNPKNLKRAKAKLATALQEVIEILTEGPCTEVYQLNTQLVPLTSRQP